MTTLTEGMSIPRNVAVCLYCGGDLYIAEIDEWDTETGTPTESGLHVACINENIDDPHDHTAMPYVNWLPVQMAVWRHYKDTPCQAWREEQQETALAHAMQRLNERERLQGDATHTLKQQIRHARGRRYYDLLKEILWREGRDIVAAAQADAPLTPLKVGTLSVQFDLNFKATCEWLEECLVIPSGTYDRIKASGLRVKDMTQGYKEAQS